MRWHDFATEVNAARTRWAATQEDDFRLGCFTPTDLLAPQPEIHVCLDTPNGTYMRPQIREFTQDSRSVLIRVAGMWLPAATAESVGSQKNLAQAYRAGYERGCEVGYGLGSDGEKNPYDGSDI